jgi:hypothetical protein
MHTSGRPSQSADFAQRLIDAADGWLALRAPEAAWEALSPLWPVCRRHPAALHQKARVLVALGKVQEARQTIHCLARLAPHLRLALLDDPALDAVWSGD